MAFSWPVKPGSPITQFFGSNPASYQPDGHTGIDFGIPVGSELYSIGTGTVVYEGWARNLGWPNPYYINPDFTPGDGIDQSAGLVILIDYGSILAIYGHLDSSIVNKGDRVTPGQLIGFSGNTGFSSGPHLHFEILPDKWNVHAAYYGRVNPLNYISEIKAPTAAPKKPNERKVGPSNVNQRKDPNTSSPIVRLIQANTMEIFSKVIEGETVSIDGLTSSLWYGDDVGWTWAGSFTEQSKDGLTDITPKAPVSLSGNQRRVGPSNVNQRKEPNTSSPVVRLIQANTVETFNKVIEGETVSIGGLISNLWYGDDQGWTWAGSYTEQKKDGLTDVTPKAPVTPSRPANQRVAGPTGGKQRKEPNTSSPVVRIIEGNAVENFRTWTRGESVTIGSTTSNVWYGDDQGWVWSGVFTEKGTGGLQEVTLTPTKPVEPPVVKPPVVVAPTPTKPVESPVEPPVGILKGELPCVTEFIPAHPDNYAVGNFPEKPEKVVVHDFGVHGTHTFTGTVNYFKMSLEERRVNDPDAGQSASHFVVSGDRIVQMVSLKNRAYHGATGGNVFIGVETDPGQNSPEDAGKTIASVKRLLKEINTYYGYEVEPIKHSSFMATECGDDVILENYTNLGFSSPVVPVTPPPIVTSNEEIVKQISELLKKIN